MSVTPSPIGGFAAQFFDNNGVILSGGKIYTYAAGTTTPQATYTSASGTTPHANPIILDSAGRVPGGEIWLTDGLVYKFVIETATAILLGTYDNITGVNSNFVNYTVQEEVITATAGQTVFNLSTINYTPGTNSLTVYIDGVNQYVGESYLETDSNTVTFTSGVHVGGEVKFTTAIQTTTGAVDASIVSFTGFKGQTGSVQDLADNDGSDWIGFNPSGTGAVARSAQDKMRDIVSVNDYGADATGTTDSSAAIQAAINAAEGKCLVAKGTFRIDSTLNLKSASIYNFHGATFIPGGATIDKMFSCVGKTDVTVIGGRYTGVPGISPVINAHPTGTYYSGTALYFQDCVNVLVTETYTYRIFSVINFYNCSDSTALANSASDCCGGIQSVAGSNISANWKVRGLNYSNNTLLHMGDECYSFLVSTLGTGEYSACKIIGNHLSKDPGVNATIGLASGIHLRGLETTSSNVVRSCVVSDNTAYFCGAAFIRATGAIRCTFANNSVDGFGKAGANAAYWFGSTGTGAYGVFDLTVIGNIAENGLDGSRVIYMEGANRNHFSSNYGVVNSAGIGAISVLSNSDTNVFDGNIIHNTAAYGIQFAAGCDNNLIINNDFSIYVASAISDSGTNNKKQNNYGYVSFNSGTTTISAGSLSQLVNHGLSGSDAARIFVSLTPVSNMYSAANAHVEGITTGLFYATVTSAPGGSNVVTFQWTAQEI